MIRYEKILFPTDLSAASAKIVPHVKTLADSFGAEIHLLYVAKANEYYVEDESEPGRSITEKVRKFMETQCKEISGAGVAVLNGEVADEIISYIEKECMDMVIMSIKGRTALGKAVFGSTAGQIVRAAGVPVFLINPHQDKFLM